MTIMSIQRDFGPNVSIVRIETDEPIENIVAGGWLATQAQSIVEANNGAFEWNDNDAVLVSFPTARINLTTGRENQGLVLCGVFPSHISLYPVAPVMPNLFGITAHPGGGQTNASQLNIGINVIITAATAGDSVILPDDVLGQTVVVQNLGANSVDVFPFLGDTINSLAVNTAIAVAAGSRAVFYGTQRLGWGSIIQP